MCVKNIYFLVRPIVFRSAPAGTQERSTAVHGASSAFYFLTCMIPFFYILSGSGLQWLMACDGHLPLNPSVMYVFPRDRWWTWWETVEHQSHSTSWMKLRTSKPKHREWTCPALRAHQLPMVWPYRLQNPNSATWLSPAQALGFLFAQTKVRWGCRVKGSQFRTTDKKKKTSENHRLPQKVTVLYLCGWNWMIKKRLFEAGNCHVLIIL